MASEKLIFIVISIIAAIFLFLSGDVRSQKLKQISLLWWWSQKKNENKRRKKRKSEKNSISSRRVNKETEHNSTLIT